APPARPARPGGLAGQVGHAGGGLSTGEAQLLAAARVHASAADVVILDEATSSLDPAAEAVVERAFAARGGTLVVIAHRLSSALRAERVLVMDGGPPLLGGHDELMAGSALYRDLMAAWQPAPAAGRPGRVPSTQDEQGAPAGAAAPPRG
ncbi:ABC transporter ATP-binding protein, partial [Saccharothrix longispora]|nr:ABC transporter ATP-binding protein [Saccharothrix longispora]